MEGKLPLVLFWKLGIVSHFVEEKAPNRIYVVNVSAADKFLVSSPEL